MLFVLSRFLAAILLLLLALREGASEPARFEREFCRGWLACLHTRNNQGSLALCFIVVCVA